MYVGLRERVWVFRPLCAPIPSVPMEAVWSGGGNLGSGMDGLTYQLCDSSFSSQSSGFLSLDFIICKMGQHYFTANCEDKMS